MRIRLWLLLAVMSAGFSGMGKPVLGEEELKVFTTVAPVAWLVEEIGGDRVAAHAAIPGGRSPHDYQPTPQEVFHICGADLYLGSGMWFEERVIRPILKNTKVPYREIGTSIVRIPVAAGDEHGDTSGLDQHIWLSPMNAVVLIRDITAVLTETRPEAEEYFQLRAEALSEKFRTLAEETRLALEPYAGRPFLVYHPAFGYLAHEFGLREIAIEQDGKMPTPRHLQELIALARENDIKVVLIQPQYNGAPARGVANALAAKVTTADPLASNLFRNLRWILEIIEQDLSK